MCRKIAGLVMKKIFLITIGEKHGGYTWIRPELSRFVEIVEDSASADVVVVIKYNRVTTQDKGEVLLDFLRLIHQIYPDKLVVAHQLNGSGDLDSHLAIRAMGVRKYHPEVAIAGTYNVEEISYLFDDDIIVGWMDGF